MSDSHWLEIKPLPQVTRQLDRMLDEALGTKDGRYVRRTYGGARAWLLVKGEPAGGPLCNGDELPKDCR